MVSGRVAISICFVLLFIGAFLLRLRGAPVLFKRADVVQDTSLGAAGTGVHAPHLGGVALADFGMTIVLSAALAAVSKGPFTFWLVITLVAAEIMHYVFGIPSATQRWLFGQ